MAVWSRSRREHKTWWFKKPVECNFDHVSHSGLFLGKSLCYWDILWTTLEHYIDGTMVHELDTANNYFCIYEKIKFAPFFLAHPVYQIAFCLQVVHVYQLCPMCSIVVYCCELSWIVLYCCLLLCIVVILLLKCCVLLWVVVYCCVLLCILTKPGLTYKKKFCEFA